MYISLNFFICCISSFSGYFFLDSMWGVNPAMHASSFFFRFLLHRSPSSLPCSTHCMASYQILLLSDHPCARSLRGMPHTEARPPYPAALTAWHDIKFYFSQIILVLVHYAACLTQKPLLSTLQHSLHGIISSFTSLRSFLCSFITRHASHRSPSSLPCNRTSLQTGSSYQQT